MFLQIQVMLDESKVFKLVARLHTDNETGLVHQQVMDLDQAVDKSFIHLLAPTMMEFKDITAIASPELIAKAFAEAEAKAATEATNASQDNMIQEGEVVELGA